MTTKTKTEADSPGAIAGTPRLESLAQIKPAAWNPRQIRDAKADAELLESVKAKGVLQSLLVRPVNSHYEVVCGTRRYDAALEAGMVAVPVMVRELDDVEVLELQTIENSQRADVHPLEEAEAYRKLHEEHGQAPEQIAAKVGKSRTWVYGRIKLCALGDTARKAFLDGKLDASTALLLARIPDAELQKKACIELTRQNHDGSLMSYRQAAEFVQSHYMLKLAEAGFKTTDADLLPTAGPCTTCPKRTGTQKELFADVKSADVCTDPKCYTAKQDAAWTQRAAAAEAQGQRVLAPAEAAKVFTKYNPEQIERNSGFVDLDDEEWIGDKNKKWRAILGKQAPTPVLARDARGNIHELVPKEAAAEALKATGKKAGALSTTLEPRSRGLSASEKKQRDEQKRKREVTIYVLSQVAAAAARFYTNTVGKDLDLDDLFRFIGEGFLEGGWHDTLAEVAKRRGIEAKKNKGAYASGYDIAGAIRKEMQLAQGGDLSGLIIEIIATRGAFWSFQGGSATTLLDKACKLLELDRKALEAQARKEISAKEKPAKKPAPAKAKPAAKKPAKKGSRK
jgi:ParB/RepB/Spo0J family partition protein